MMHRQANKTNNKAQSLRAPAVTNVSNPSAVKETLRRETSGLDALRHEKSINEEFSYLISQIPALWKFKNPVVLGTVVEGPAEYNRKISGGTLIIDTDYVKPLCEIYKLGENFSKGIDVIFRHELAHEQVKCWYRDIKEAAVELFAISRRGFKDLVDQLAVMLVVDICQPYTFLDRKNYGADIIKWIESSLDYYAVDRWHDAVFIKFVSKFFKPAKNVARGIPTDYSRITKLVVRRAIDIIEALNNSEETTSATKSSLKIISPALYNNSIT